MFRRPTSLSLFVLASCVLFSAQAQAQVTPYHLVDVIYSWPTPYPVGDSTLQTTFTVLDDPGPDTSYYFAHFFSLGPYTGDANNTTGYFGIQTNSSGQREAIFSLWNATDAAGVNCSTFGNEGVGWHCLIDYPWVINHAYTMTVQRTQGPQLDTWVASINDTTTGASTPIGQIFGAHTDERPSASWLFYEYYQPVASCEALPHVRMIFSGVTGENGAVTPTLEPNAIFYEGPCADNITTTVCGNTVYNEASGDFSRSAGDVGMDPNIGCKEPLPGDTTGGASTGAAPIGSTTDANSATTGAMPSTSGTTGGTSGTTGGTSSTTGGTSSTTGGTSGTNTVGEGSTTPVGTASTGAPASGNPAAVTTASPTASTQNEPPHYAIANTTYAGCSSTKASEPIALLLMAFLSFRLRKKGRSPVALRVTL